MSECALCGGKVEEEDWCYDCRDYHHWDCVTDLNEEVAKKIETDGKDPLLYGDGPSDYKDE